MALQACARNSLRTWNSGALEMARTPALIARHAMVQNLVRASANDRLVGRGVIPAAPRYRDATEILLRAAGVRARAGRGARCPFPALPRRRLAGGHGAELDLAPYGARVHRQPAAGRTVCPGGKTPARRKIVGLRTGLEARRRIASAPDEAAAGRRS